MVMLQLLGKATSSITFLDRGVLRFKARRYSNCKHKSFLNKSFLNREYVLINCKHKLFKTSTRFSYDTLTNIYLKVHNFKFVYDKRIFHVGYANIGHMITLCNISYIFSQNKNV